MIDNTEMSNMSSFTCILVAAAAQTEQGGVTNINVLTSENAWVGVG